MKIRFINTVENRGNAIGYYTHIKNLYETMVKMGIVDNYDYDIALHIIPACHYKSIPGKKNVLYTMYEYTELPENWVRNLKDIDLIVVPCLHNKELFKKYTDIPISICLEGCNSDYFEYIPREFPKDRPFNFLWLSANNWRKGYLNVLATWIPFHKKYPNTSLTIKSLMNNKPEKTRPEVIPGVIWDKENNIILDRRKLPLKAEGDLPGLIDVYKYANIFLMPSMGEGFCLPLCEALSTGLPCVYTPWSAPLDYMGDYGYPAEYIMVPVHIIERFMPENELVEFSPQAAYALPQSIFNNMEKIYLDYESALARAKKGAEMVREKLTWGKSAQNLINLLGGL